MNVIACCGIKWFFASILIGLFGISDQKNSLKSLTKIFHMFFRIMQDGKETIVHTCSKVLLQPKKNLLSWMINE